MTYLRHFNFLVCLHVGMQLIFPNKKHNPNSPSHWKLDFSFLFFSLEQNNFVELTHVHCSLSHISKWTRLVVITRCTVGCVVWVWISKRGAWITCISFCFTQNIRNMHWMYWMYFRVHNMNHARHKMTSPWSSIGWRGVGSAMLWVNHHHHG